MCTGRVDLDFVLRAFLKGVDGVLIVGCHLNECNYLTHGNFYAMSMVHLGKKLLEQKGLDPQRLRMATVSGGEASRFVDIANEFAETVRKLGPSGRGEGLDPEQMRSGLAELSRLVPYIKLSLKDKLTVHLADEEAYGQLYRRDEVETLLREVVSYDVDPARCQACMMCAKNCPVDAIEGGKRRIHVINQEKCIKCGKCFEICPPRFGAVAKISGRPIPPPLPEDERTLDRRRKAD